MNESNDLFELLARVEWLLRRYHMMNHRVHGPMGDPHRGQGRILALLKLQPEISQRELGFLLDMRPQSLGELLMKLERSGYITRTQAEDDRRAMTIRLTDEGRQAAEQKVEAADLFACLNDEEQRTLGDYLRRIVATLEQQLGDEPVDRDRPWGFDGPDRREFGGDRRGCGRVPFAADGAERDFGPGPWGKGHGCHGDHDDHDHDDRGCHGKHGDHEGHGCHGEHGDHEGHRCHDGHREHEGHDCHGEDDGHHHGHHHHRGCHGERD